MHACLSEGRAYAHCDGTLFPAAALALLTFTDGSLGTVQMDPAKANSSLDIGPASDTPAAAAFREFWGDRAETWRLKVPIHSILSAPHK